MYKNATPPPPPPPPPPPSVSFLNNLIIIHYISVEAEGVDQFLSTIVAKGSPEAIHLEPAKNPFQEELDA